MEHFTIWDHIRHFIHCLFHPEKQRKVDSEQIKKNMCAGVRAADGCGYFCEYCAWNYEGNEQASKRADKHI